MWANAKYNLKVYFFVFETFDRLLLRMVYKLWIGTSNVDLVSFKIYLEWQKVGPYLNGQSV